jgi:hypothetical protein
MTDENWPQSPYVPDAGQISEEEKAIIEGFEEKIVPEYPLGTVSATLVGKYPDTVIRVTLTKGSESQSEDFSLWDGKLIGAPSGGGTGGDDFILMLGVAILEWFTSPKWGRETAS